MWGRRNFRARAWRRRCKIRCRRRWNLLLWWCCRILSELWCILWICFCFLWVCIWCCVRIWSMKLWSRWNRSSRLRGIIRVWALRCRVRGMMLLFSMMWISFGMMCLRINLFCVLWLIVVLFLEMLWWLILTSCALTTTVSTASRCKGCNKRRFNLILMVVILSFLVCLRIL